MQKKKKIQSGAMGSPFGRQPFASQDFQQITRGGFWGGEMSVWNKKDGG